MRRLNALLLEVGLLISAVGAMLYAARVILGSLYDVTWYWGGALAAFAGPVAFSVALRLLDGRSERFAEKAATE